MKFHISNDNIIRECKATEKCPLISSDKVSLQLQSGSSKEAQKTYERFLNKAINTFPHKEFKEPLNMSSDDKIIQLNTTLNSLIKDYDETVGDYTATYYDEDDDYYYDDTDDDSFYDIKGLDGNDIKYFEDFKNYRNAVGNCSIVSERIVQDFSFNFNLDGYTVDIIDAEPNGTFLLNHVANVIKDKDDNELVVDFTYSQINPDAPYPAIFTKEDWLHNVDIASKKPHPVIYDYYLKEKNLDISDF